LFALRSLKYPLTFCIDEALEFKVGHALGNAKNKKLFGIYTCLCPEPK